MQKIKDITEIKGKFKKHRNTFTYRDDLIICERKGSVVEIKDDYIQILADVTGIDKIYFKITDQKIKISNRFKDFEENNVDKGFIAIQETKGYVPYPFTILKGVRKAPPGLITIIKINTSGSLEYLFEASDELGIFNVNKKFNKKSFRKDLDKLLKQNFKNHTGMISSFSGGFDSLFLTKIYDRKCKHIIHFSEDDTIRIDYYKDIFPGIKWTVIDGNKEFSEADKIKYFNSVDEPCCDPSGFAEYLMIKELASNKKLKSLPIVNGQSSDGIFCNGRKYFQSFISSKVPFNLGNVQFIQNRRNGWIISHLYDYSLSIKKRFFEIYLSGYPLPDRAYEELEKIYSIYATSIRNDDANFLASLIIMLKYSIYEIEKIKTVSRAFNVKYYLPFMSTNIIGLGFSTPSKYKVGFKIGKRILIQSYPEIESMKFVSRDFKPQKLKERLIGEKPSESKYQSYYLKNWMKYNEVHS